MPWIDAIATDDVEEGDVVRWDFQDETFVIIHGEDGRFYCTAGRCTHQQVHLSGGFVIDNAIECPRHNGVFDYRSGKALRAPACIDLATFETKVEGARVFVLIS